jgi:hypothetical protein
MVYLESFMPCPSTVCSFIQGLICNANSISYCVGTRRKAQLDHEQIERCRWILDSDHVTNFETRMVAEVNLYWIIYESCSRGTVDVPGTQAVLDTWKQEWKFLFGVFPLHHSHTASHVTLRPTTSPICADGLPFRTASHL